VRTLFDPLKWLILDAAGNPMYSDSSDTSSNSQNDMVYAYPSQMDFHPAAKPLLTIPVPPIPRLFQDMPVMVTEPLRLSESESVASSLGDNLNPDVPEFVPIESSAVKSDESTAMHEEQLIEKPGVADAKKEEIANLGLSSKSQEGVKEKSDLPLTNGEAQLVIDDVWKEVRTARTWHTYPSREQTFFSFTSFLGNWDICIIIIIIFIFFSHFTFS
jgi:hypothetical protein